MKRVVLAAAVAGLAIAGTVGGAGIASAKETGMETGISTTLSARHYGWHHRHHYRGWRSHYAGCRVVVRSHINRWGHRVFVRKRICY